MNNIGTPSAIPQYTVEVRDEDGLQVVVARIHTPGPAEALVKVSLADPAADWLMVPEPEHEEPGISGGEAS